ncbi:bifunctional aspartate transaminase/aspartate 4-decarboxylase [Streptomyces sp. NPDC058701]|uniref:bifunctional aspartate transaminase/aspartate 4-decarboxylase n=1 Tax=Streptomyces sp. NPDC058701 TaxID=3346608 RepID=UPI0036534DC5
MGVLRDNPELALFLCLAVGYLVGKLRVGPITLGGICGTLIVSLLVGAWAHVEIDKDAYVHELTDAITGDNYPVPDRMLVHAEQVVRGYVGDEMFDKRPPAGDLSLFATEGGTAAMCYIVDSLMKNGVLHKGDKIALMTPVFTPYIEIPELDTFEFEVVNVSASLFAETGVRQWRYPEEEIAKLADPSVKLVCLVNPSNPPSLALSERMAHQMKDIVATGNPNLLIVTDDVYGTFVPGFRSIAIDLPRNTLLVYSYSKHYGCTGWRLGVIGLHDDNVVDEMIAGFPQDQKDRLAKRYGTLTLEPEKIRFIDRMVLEKNYEPVDPLFRLAEQTSVVLLNGGGFDGPQWSVRVSLANLDDLDYLKIGHHLRRIFNDYAAEWERAKASV